MKRERRQFPSDGATLRIAVVMMPPDKGKPHCCSLVVYRGCKQFKHSSCLSPGYLGAHVLRQCEQRLACAVSTLNDHNLLRPVNTELYLTYLCRQTSPHTTPDLYLRQSFNLICLQRCSNLLPIKSRAWQGHVNMCSDVTPAETSQSHPRQVR